MRVSTAAPPHRTTSRLSDEDRGRHDPAHADPPPTPPPLLLDSRRRLSQHADRSAERLGVQRLRAVRAGRGGRWPHRRGDRRRRRAARCDRGPSSGEPHVREHGRGARRRRRGVLPLDAHDGLPVERLDGRGRARARETGVRRRGGVVHPVEQAQGSLRGGPRGGGGRARAGRARSQPAGVDAAGLSARGHGPERGRSSATARDRRRAQPARHRLPDQHRRGLHEGPLDRGGARGSPGGLRRHASPVRGRLRPGHEGADREPGVHVRGGRVHAPQALAGTRPARTEERGRARAAARAAAREGAAARVREHGGVRDRDPHGAERGRGVEVLRGAAPQAPSQGAGRLRGVPGRQARAHGRSGGRAEGLGLQLLQELAPAGEVRRRLRGGGRVLPAGRRARRTVRRDAAPLRCRVQERHRGHRRSRTALVARGRAPVRGLGPGRGRDDRRVLSGPPPPAEQIQPRGAVPDPPPQALAATASSRCRWSRSSATSRSPPRRNRRC